MPKTLGSPSVTRRRRPSRLISVEQRASLADLLTSARRERGWTAAQLARAAERHLAAPANRRRLDAAGLRHDVGVSDDHVYYLESARSQAPMGTTARRARLLGIGLALELDLAELNLIGGGI